MNARQALTALSLALAALTGTTAAHAQVGMDQLQVDDIAVTLVYPTPAKTTSQTIGPFTLDVAVRAPLAPGQHSLVVMSHGSGGSALPDHALAADLVRAGFVVAQPLHVGDNFQDQTQSGPASFQRRPGEVSRVITALATNPRWSSQLQLNRVGVHGMSAGGVTGLSLAGAQWRTLNLIQHCNAHLDDDIGFCLQGATTPEQRAERLAGFERARNAPEAFLPAALTTWHGGRNPSTPSNETRPDPRVASVSLSVPVSAIFSADSLARIRIPVGIVRAEADQVLVLRFHTDHVLRHCTTCTLLADLPGAGHFDVLWPWPASVAQAVAAAQPRGGMPNPTLSPEARAAARAKIVQFHLTHLTPPNAS
jgi:predicted dienelactone hydrolase